MTKSWLSVFVFAMMVFSAVAYAGSGVDLEEGMWEVTTRVKMQGMDMPARTFSQCITEADMVPEGQSDQQGSCKVFDVKTSGNTVSWKMVCRTEGGEMQSEGKITYKGGRFEGASTMRMMGMNIVTKMSGKRTGPCE
jgi:hypothetical protein